MMGKQMPTSAATRRLRAVPLLLLVTCCSPLLGSAPAAPEALRSLGGFTYPYGSILSPLLRALSEHGGSRWSSGPRRKTMTMLTTTMKPEHRYMKYLTDVYKKSSRVKRSIDGDKLYNTIRLMKPQDECVTQSSEDHFIQDLSYSLDQVRSKEQLLKAALLYSLDWDASAPVRSMCHLSIKEREESHRCQLCAEVHRSLNFTASAGRRRRRNWVEVDVTSFFHHFESCQKKSVHLLVNVTCPEERRAGSNSFIELLEFTLRSPPLILYLNDTSKVAHQRSQVNAGAGQRLSDASQKQSRGHKSRWRRESTKSKRGDKNLDVQLPELLPSSEFPTTDCALYDFRVRFSQLRLDHWIVFPPKYNPRYCRGICPRTMGFIYGSPVHTMVQNIIYEKLDSSVPRPSCVPSHYSPLSVMIFEEDGSYVYKEFKDMVATRCTCR